MCRKVKSNGVTHSYIGPDGAGHPPGGPTAQTSSGLTNRVKFEFLRAAKNRRQEHALEGMAGLPGKDAEYAPLGVLLVRD